MIPHSLFDDNIHIQAFLSADVVFKDDKGAPFYSIRYASDSDRQNVVHSIYRRLQEDEQLMEQYGYKTESHLKSYSIHLGDSRFIVSRTVDHLDNNSIDVRVVYHDTATFFHTSDDVELYDCVLCLLFNREETIVFNPLIADDTTRATAFFDFDESEIEESLPESLYDRLRQLRKSGWKKTRFSCLSFYPYLG